MLHYRRDFLLFLILSLLFLGIYYVNILYEWFAYHPFTGGSYRDLRVMTWNINYQRPDLNEDDITDVILAQDADVVLLNEFNADSCGVIDSILRIQYPFVVDEWAKNECGDVMYGRLPMSNYGHRQIPILGRAVPEIQMVASVGSDSIYIMGCHLASNNDSTYRYVVTDMSRLATISDYYEAYKQAREKRCFETEYLKDWTKENLHPVIVMGDMNDFSFSKPLRILEEAGLTDSWWEGGFGIGNTFHTGLMHLRIDHIYHSKELKLVGIWVVDTDLSDHCPLVADFKLE